MRDRLAKTPMRGIAAGVAALVVVSLIAAAVVGRVAAADGGFDWTAAALAATAAGTIALAAATGWLAYATYRDVLLRDRPELITRDPPWFDRDARKLKLVLTNVGGGPAFNLQFTLKLTHPSIQIPEHQQPESYPVVAPGETRSFTLNTPFATEPSATLNPVDFDVSVSYRDRLQNVSWLDTSGMDGLHQANSELGNT